MKARDFPGNILSQEKIGLFFDIKTVNYRTRIAEAEIGISLKAQNSCIELPRQFSKTKTIIDDHREASSVHGGISRLT